jgi:PAS domain-containing protein
MPATARDVSRANGDGGSAFHRTRVFRSASVGDFPMQATRLSYSLTTLPALRSTTTRSGDPMATTITPTHAESFSRIAEALGIGPPVIDDLLEHIPVGLMVVDANGTMVFANVAARSLRIDRLEPLQWAITRALLTEDNVHEDEIAIAPLGEPRRWISARIVPVRVPKLGVNAAFVILSDVTARRQMAAWTPMIESLVRL